MKKVMVIVCSILIAITFTLTTTKKAEAFDIGFVIGPLIPVVMIIGDFILYRQHPECRKADTMGALGECVQKAGTSEQEKVEGTTEER